MPKFGETSRSRLENVHPDLIALFEEVVKRFDCTIIYGHRTVNEQQALYAQGRTQPGPIVTNCDGVRKKSMHNHMPSLAVDVAPYPINWRDSNRFYHFAGYVRRVAENMNIPIRWGGDWNMNTDLSDQSFFDLPHFELVE